MTSHASTSWREHFGSRLTLHCAALTSLLTLVVGIALRLSFVWNSAHGSVISALANKQQQLEELKLETVPLRGLDQRVAQSKMQVQAFYAGRIPSNYSAIVTRIGELEVKSGARLSRVQYSQGHHVADLAEISMDASISGEYPQIMRFVNDMERDQTFFVIKAMALTGQQGGIVSLRLRVSSWLRGSEADSSGLPLMPETPGSDPSPSAFGKGAE
jgi:type IV pilus assembly protein PilO